MTGKVEVLDAIMGSGKTTKIIEWMLNNPSQKYLYISPMLSEVEERIPTACEALEFTFPNTEEHTTKSSHLLELLKMGCNIAFTHSLFTDLSKRHLDLIAKNGYTLIIDEEVSLIDTYNGRYKKGDITALERAGHIKVHEDDLGRVEWLWEDMTEYTLYSGLRKICEMEMLYCTKRNRDMMVTQLPISLISSSKRTIILSYLFKGSVMESFLKLRGIEVTPFTEVQLLKDTTTVLRDAKELINICSTPATRAVRSYGMSYSWYTQTASKSQLEKVGAAIRAVGRKAGKDSLLVTVPKESITKELSGKRNSRYILPRGVSVEDTFLYCGARATNNYSDRSVLIHGFNRYINLVVKSYLQDYGEELDAVPDDDLFALSEMVQWIWRSRIRNNKPIDIYILPKRMETLLIRWLDGEFSD